MQINPGVRTIEGVLEAAIHKAGGISKDNAGDLAKVKSATFGYNTQCVSMSFQRAPTNKAPACLDSNNCWNLERKDDKQ